MHLFQFYCSVYIQCRSFSKFLVVSTWIQFHLQYYFIEVLQGDFKNGTNTIRDYRSLSAVCIIIQVLLGVVLLNPFQGHGTLLILIVYLFIMIVFSLCHPYRKKKDNHVAFLQLFLAFCITSGFLMWPPALNGRFHSIKIWIHILTGLLLISHIVVYSYILYKNNYEEHRNSQIYTLSMYKASLQCVCKERIWAYSMKYCSSISNDCCYCFFYVIW